MKSSRKKNCRKPVVIESDTQLGPLKAVALYMKVGRTWLSALKRCAKKRDTTENPSCFYGQKTCAMSVRHWLERNRDFVAAREYTK